METYQPLQERVYNQLKQKIENHEFEPGVIYSETKMSQELATSRTPFKIALARLSQEKYIDIIPSKGFRLHVFDAEDIINLYQKRTAIEVFCAFMVIEDKGEESFNRVVEKLKDKMDKMRICMENKEKINEFLWLDGQFHCDLVQYVNNKDFSQEYSQVLFRQVISVSGDSYLDPDYMEKMYEEHSVILSAIEEGNREKCYEAIRHHLETAQATGLKRIEKMSL